MAYNNYFPATYTPIGGYGIPTVQPPAAQQQNNGNGIVWVQGESGAKSYLVAPGMTVLLMDSEGDRFYIKSSDASGMPLPLRVFSYKEETERSVFPGEEKYATKKDLEDLRKQIRELTNKEEDNE